MSARHALAAVLLVLTAAAPSFADWDADEDDNVLYILGDEDWAEPEGFEGMGYGYLQEVRVTYDDDEILVTWRVVGAVDEDGDEIEDDEDFDIEDVDLIVYLGTNAHDFFHNQTDIPCIVYGMGGNDLLYGGSGNDELYGGPGSDFLNAGQGNDLLDFGYDDVETGIQAHPSLGLDTVVVNYRPEYVDGEYVWVPDFPEFSQQAPFDYDLVEIEPRYLSKDTNLLADPNRRRSPDLINPARPTQEVPVQRRP